MKKLWLLFIVTLFTLSWSNLSIGQVSLTGIGTAYTQNFDGLPSVVGTTTWTDNTTLAGWYSTQTSLITGTGSGTAGGLYSFGVAGTNPVTDRALGGLSSGSASPSWAVKLVNNTGSTITAFEIAFTGVEWRVNSSYQTLTFDYQVGATSITTGTWTSASALNFTAPQIGSGAAVDGNAAANRTAFSNVIFATVGVGQTIWLRWSKTATSSPGLAIDDFSVTPQAPTISQLYSKSSGFLNDLGTWGPNTDGSGSAPANFTANYQVFNIRNNATPSVSAAWTVSGLGSRVVLGDGSSVSLTIPNGSAYSGVIDVSANATLVLQDATIPSLSAINIASTVDFAQTGTVVVPAANYGNLKITNGTKTLGGNTTTVNGNLVVDAVTGFTGSTTPNPFTTLNLLGDLTCQNGTTWSTNPAPGMTINCNGPSVQTFSSNGGDTMRVFRVQVNNTAGVVLATTGGSTNVVAGNQSGGGFTTQTGPLTTNSNTAVLYSGPSCVVLSESGTHYIVGNAYYKYTIGILTSAMGNLLWAGGLKAEVSPDDLGKVSVKRVTGTGGIVTVGGSSGIKCTWTISSDNPPTNGRSVILGWVSDLSNGKDLTVMQAWRSTNSGTSWASIGSSYDATLAPFFTRDSLAGVTSFGMFTVSDVDNPLGAVTTPSIGITALIEGFYNGSTMVSDTVNVQLHNSLSPYAVVTSRKGVLSTSGSHTFNFPAGTSGTGYYIGIKHRNAVETRSEERRVGKECRSR